MLDRVARGERLSETEAEAAFDLLLEGTATPAQIAALLIGLRVRGETTGELIGAVRAMRARMLPVTAPADAIDVCGTGGDAHGTLNVSTAVAFVLAALGVPPLTEPAALQRQLARRNIAFLAAPAHHPALRHVAPVRAELGTRTLFNLLGPLCNPASVSLQLIGVFDRAWLEPVALTLRRLGAARVWAVHGDDASRPGGQGLDELTLAGLNHVVALERGQLHRFTLDAASLGLAPAPVSEIAGGDAAVNAAALEALLRGGRDAGQRAYRDTVLLNAAAALRVARGGNMFPPGPEASDLREAIAAAARVLEDGSAYRVLEALRSDRADQGGSQS